MQVGPEPPLDHAFDEAVMLVNNALRRTAPIAGVIDLPPFDPGAGHLTHAQRRALVTEQLPLPIPLPIRIEQPPAAVSAARRSPPARRFALWLLFVAAVASMALPALSLALGVAWFVVLVWPSRPGVNAPPDETEPDSDGARGGRGDATDIELRIIWMARWQAAAIIGSRAWNSDELGGANRIDIARTLESLTERALSLLQFASTALPKPSRSQPELRRQWQREQERIESIRGELVEQVAAMIMYRERLELISDLLEQRDQMAVLSERAAAFDQILPPTTDGQDLLDATGEHRDLQANLAAQIQYLGDLTDGWGAGLPRRGSRRSL
ncbi:hypothetical protein [Dietzia lutea]|uniref:Uncharacterized protein n=1 Tax=Dietzia lutea TaxID=546160 RepID=A0A2S1R6G9_9ACTN|nr:hypothetical protein [Dietzia lutea]AWH91887.1 hypothetical protein A6035_06620 [Dietzia lutea]